MSLMLEKFPFSVIKWGGVLLASDIISAFLSPFISFEYRYLTTGPYPMGRNFLIYAFICAFSTLILLRSSGVSRVNWRFFSSADAFTAGAAITFGVIIGVTIEYFYGRLQAFPRSVPLVQILVQALAFVGPRIVARYLVNPIRGELPDAARVMIIGCNQTAMAYLAAVAAVGSGSIKVVAALTHDRTMVGHIMRGVPIVGTFNRFADALRLLRMHGVEISRIVFAAADLEIDADTKANILAAAEQHGIQIVDIHTLFTSVAARADFDELELESIALRGPYWTLKRLLDIFVSSILLAVLFPVFLIVAAIVFLDVGRPIFFWQERYGREGRRFYMQKFRSMRSLNGGEELSREDENRISEIGALLRRYRIDELPQLWNVLKGEMSFIGPRPLLLEDQPGNMSERLSVRPGLSGWAQINAGRLATREEKGALDLWYISHASLALDIKIAILTLKMLFFGDHCNQKEINRALEWLENNDA